MAQSRAMSALEAAAHLALGGLVALVTQLLVVPVVGLQATVAQTLWIAGAFTAVTGIRAYLLRRAFDRLGAGRQ